MTKYFFSEANCFMDCRQEPHDFNKSKSCVCCSPKTSTTRQSDGELGLHDFIESPTQYPLVDDNCLPDIIDENLNTRRGPSHAQPSQRPSDEQVPDAIVFEAASTKQQAAGTAYNELRQLLSRATCQVSSPAVCPFLGLTELIFSISTDVQGDPLRRKEKKRR